MTNSIANDLRAEIARILDNYSGKHLAIAPVKVSTLRAIDKLLNPEPDTFRIPTERTDAAPYRAMEQARIDRLEEQGAA